MFKINNQTSLQEKGKVKDLKEKKTSENGTFFFPFYLLFQKNIKKYCF